MRFIHMTTAGTLAAACLAVARPAHAASCSAVPAEWGGPGSVCVNHDPHGYQAIYHKTGGFDVVLDFNLWCANGQWFGDEGAFQISAGQTKSYVFSVGNKGACKVQLKFGGDVIAESPYEG